MDIIVFFSAAALLVWHSVCFMTTWNMQINIVFFLLFLFAKHAHFVCQTAMKMNMLCVCSTNKIYTILWMLSFWCWHPTYYLKIIRLDCLFRNCVTNVLGIKSRMMPSSRAIYSSSACTLHKYIYIYNMHVEQLYCSANFPFTSNVEPIGIIDFVSLTTMHLKMTMQ